LTQKLLTFQLFNSQLSNPKPVTHNSQLFPIFVFMEELRNYINNIRREFSSQKLDESSVGDNPYQLFEKWFEEAVGSQILDPYAMIISTVSKEGKPSNRVVYLRDISEKGLVFYTNYESHKGNDLDANKNISCLFFWGELERQIRIEGVVE